jgi:CubicO group peptidase (beta-lactamase class C family)
MASSVFVAGRSEAEINEVDNNFPLIKLAKTQVNFNQKEATSSVYGLMQRTAVHRNGLGTVLINADYKPLLLQPKRLKINKDLPFPYGDAEPRDTLFPNIDYAMLEKAIQNAFSSPEIKRTRTVLVLYKDHIIAEKYSDGFNKNTPILGWSMTKSVLATLFGILKKENLIQLDQPAPIPAWEADDRKNITVNHLLRMQSGLAWDEDYTTISDVTQMLFLDADMTKAQLEKKAIAKPLEVWNYSSGTSNLLSGILRQQFKTHQEYLNFPYSALIDKIGMHSMLLEADMEGNFVGSSYGWATTRDWAKFGLLYLHQGNWNGEVIFNPSWVDYITTPTPHSDGTYGAHFWLNAGGKFPEVPKDLFSANGYQGQYVFIIPSKELVVVRTGLAEDPVFDVNQFLKEIIDAIK